MFIELSKAFSLIFFAEMGDKSQLLAMTYATKYKVRNVLMGVTIGIFLNHLLAVLLGTFITSVIPIENISIFAGIVFIIFGYFSLQMTEELKDVKKTKVGVILTISIAMFLGELGDKTQLSTIILASEATYPYIILAGTVSAMVLTSIFGIYVGIKYGSKIPEFTLKVLSSLVFICFGLIKVIDNLPSSSNLILIIFGSFALIALYGYVFLRFRRKFNEFEQGTLQRKAEELHKHFLLIDERLKDICLGLEKCNTCQKNFCLIGYTKSIIKDAINKRNINLEDLSTKILKDYDKHKIVEALDIVLTFLKQDWNNKNYVVLHEVRKSFELILFSIKIEANSYDEYENKKISIN